MNYLLRVPFLLLALGLGWQSTDLYAQTKEVQLVESSIDVLDEIMAIPSRQIPQSLLADARGVAIVPNVVKGGFVVGVRHGRGVMLVRNDAGAWQPPMFISLTGGSIGWQAGIQATDLVMVFKTRKSVNGLMNGKFTLGVDAAAAAGPVGRKVSAATDARLAAEILSYSRSRGLFAGVSFDGSALQLDHLAGQAFYQHPILNAAGQSIRPGLTLPPSAIELMNRLTRYTGVRYSVAQRGIPQPAASTALVTTQLGQGGVQLVDARHAVRNESERVRWQLAASWQSLSQLLDGRWRAYLQPPPAVLAAGQEVDIQALNTSLQRYALIASNVHYAVLHQRPEFTTMHQLLREYVTRQTKATTRLTLPSPPDQNATPRPKRY